MKKNFFFIIAAIFSPPFLLKVNAQMMGRSDETVGSAIWDKLQNNHTTCRNLTNSDFNKLGDFFMDNMMDANHDYMEQQGDTQMHIAMGKKYGRYLPTLSGCLLLFS